MLPDAAGGECERHEHTHLKSCGPTHFLESVLSNCSFIEQPVKASNIKKTVLVGYVLFVNVAFELTIEEVLLK